MTTLEICDLLDRKLEPIVSECRAEVGGRGEDFYAAMTGFMLQTAVAVSKAYGVSRTDVLQAFHKILTKHYG